MKIQKPIISIILPTYNEVENIVDLIYAIDSYVKDNREIIVVDDNSPDGTSNVVQAEINLQKIVNLRLITRTKNRGLTNSIWEGITSSKGQIIVWLDCDFSHPPSLIPTLIDRLNEGYDIAVASRYIQGGGYKKNLSDSNDSWMPVFLSRLMNYFIQLVLSPRFKDYTSGFIAIRKRVFKQIHLKGDYGEYFIDLMMRAILEGYSFVEIPFQNLPRAKGESKTGSNLPQLISRGLKYLSTVIELVHLRIKYKLGFLHAQ